MADDYTPKLAAYMDGELPASEMKALDGHVRSCPSCAADLLGQVQLKRTVQAAGRRYRPSPEFRARIERQIAGRPVPSVWSLWLTAAAVVVILFVGFLAAIYGGRRGLERERVFSEIADLHVAALASANPVDVVSTDRHTVKPWFQGKIPFTFNLPELQNSEFSLAGGRLTYLEQVPGAQLIYGIRKHQISVFIFQDRDLKGGLSSGFGSRRRNSFDLETWSQDGLRYFVIGDAGAEDIRNLATLLKAAQGS
jgi:anti-sigma factor RsiW